MTVVTPSPYRPAFRPRLWTVAGLSALALAACGDGGVMKEEPTPPPSNTGALAQPGTVEEAAQKAADDARARDAAVMNGTAVQADAGKAPSDIPRRLPDGVGEGGEPGSPPPT